MQVQRTTASLVAARGGSAQDGLNTPAESRRYFPLDFPDRLEAFNNQARINVGLGHGAKDKADIGDQSVGPLVDVPDGQPA